MKAIEQTELVNNICDSIKTQINAKINLGKIPENWDGFELRQLVADIAKRETMDAIWHSFGDKRSKRRRDYENEIIIKNLI